MSGEKNIVEKTAVIKTVDEESCRQLGGIFEDGRCIVKIVEDLRKPNEIKIIKLREEYEI